MDDSATTSSSGAEVKIFKKMEEGTAKSEGELENGKEVVDAKDLASEQVC